MTTLQVTDLTVRHPVPRDSLAAVDGVSLEIPSGTTLGLVGSPAPENPVWPAQSSASSPCRVAGS
ncbi:hypothetical protein ACFQ2K_46585 [Streptomyces sanglieri]|uniref:ABC transporter ATP-binding protein n=1 Tax=Streptomyces sanglieri TaxID=193460 RepID=A0ABW2X5B5_9ACTN